MFVVVDYVTKVEVVWIDFHENNSFLTVCMKIFRTEFRRYLSNHLGTDSWSWIAWPAYKAFSLSPHLQECKKKT
jgi:hypothetical protein